MIINYKRLNDNTTKEYLLGKIKDFTILVNLIVNQDFGKLKYIQKVYVGQPFCVQKGILNG